MNTHFKNTDQALTLALERRAEQKLAKIARYIDEGTFEAQAFVTVAKATGAHQSGDVWEASINVDTKGDRYNASAVRDTAGKALDASLIELANELRKARAREKTLARKEGGIWKAVQRGFGMGR